MTRDVLFIGSFDHHPNIVPCYCAAEVWPLIIRQIPSARLIIIGPNPPPEIQELAPSVIVKGYVPDIEPELLRQESSSHRLDMGRHERQDRTGLKLRDTHCDDGHRGEGFSFRE